MHANEDSSTKGSEARANAVGPPSDKEESYGASPPVSSVEPLSLSSRRSTSPEDLDSFRPQVGEYRSVQHGW